MLALALALVAVVALGPIFGWLRALVGVLMFFGIVAVGTRQMQSMVKAPPDPEPMDVRDQGLRYVCSMCGLELKLEVAAKERAPSHCMEPMTLVRSGGKPPLFPVE